MQNALLHDDTLKYIYSIPFKFYKHELLLPLKRIAFSVVIHAEYEGGNIAEKQITVLLLGNSSRPRSDTVARKTTVVKAREVNDNNEGYIKHDIPTLVDVSLLQ